MLLEVRDLRVAYRDGGSTVHALRGVSLSLEPRECLGVIGESGCGKSTLVRAVLRLLPRNARYLSGEILFDGRDLLTLDHAELRRIRWKRIAMMPQSSMNSLNPVLSVGQQLVEAIRVHESVDRRRALERAAGLLETVGLSRSRLGTFPHELSGGSKQRVCLAMSIALSPDLLIADEPTTALDVVMQRHILNELRLIRRRFDMAMLLVSHDVSVVAENCDRVVVMYGGCVVEVGPTRTVLDRPYHPYTMGLRNAFPQIDGTRKAISIPGQPPDLRAPPPGCVFASRCPLVSARCQTSPPPLEELEPAHLAACWLTEDAAAFRSRSADAEAWTQKAPVPVRVAVS